MVVASGQLPYEYNSSLPIRQRRDGWPLGGGPDIGPSGDLIEQGMFVLNAELRKWAINQLDLLTYKLYTNPNLPSSGFEPKNNGQTFIGLVGKPGFLASDNIEQMRENLEIHLFNQYADDSVYGSEDFMESWLTTAYPESPSGYLRIVSNGFGGFILNGRTFLRPPLEDIINGNQITTTDLHWLGGSGVFMDIDLGEVIFQPFPFPRVDFNFSPSINNMTFNFGPLYPVVQTTAGTIPSVLASRYRTDIANGQFKAETNFEALQSGIIQIDGYVIVPSSLVRLTKGNDNNYSLAGSPDFTYITNGVRSVDGSLGKNDITARAYIQPKPQSSGVYRVTIVNPKSINPLMAISSGFVSFWPQGDARGQPQPNRMLDRSIFITSDGGQRVVSVNSAGHHVLDDSFWMTGRNSSTLSGTFDSRGLYICSPYNGNLVWYRPAERTAATSGNKPGGASPLGSPGHFGVHLGLEEFDSNDFIRISRVWNETLTPGTPDIFDNIVYWQKYNKTNLNHSEVSTAWTINNDDGTIGNRIDGSLFDGTNYWIWFENNRLTRFTSALVFDGQFLASSPGIARRRHFANGKHLYTIAGNIQIGDPLSTMSPAGGIASGIGVWSVSVEPPSITDDIGTVVHTSAKRLRAETHFGHKTDARIHMIREISGASHIPNGVWMLIQFPNPNKLYLCKIREDATEWVVEHSIEIFHTPQAIVAGSIPVDFPYEFIDHPIN